MAAPQTSPYGPTNIGTATEGSMQAAGRDDAAASTSQSLQGDYTTIVQRVTFAKTDFWTRKPTVCYTLPQSTRAFTSVS